MHVRVQHIPLINLMGLMTFFERNVFLEILDHFWPLINRIWRFQHRNYQKREMEFRNCDFAILGASEPPPPPPPPTTTTHPQVRPGPPATSFWVPPEARGAACEGQAHHYRTKCPLPILSAAQHTLIPLHRYRQGRRSRRRAGQLRRYGGKAGLALLPSPTTSATPAPPYPQPPTRRAWQSWCPLCPICCGGRGGLTAMVLPI